MKPIRITTLSLDSYILPHELPTMVLFCSQWDFKSIKLLYQLDEIGKRYDGTILVGYVDVDTHSEIFYRYDIIDFPTTTIFEDGKMIYKVGGYSGSSDLENAINWYLGVPRKKDKF